MRRRSGRALAAILALPVILLAAAVLLVPRGAHLVSTGAGLAAGHLCSGVFVAGRSADAVRREELRGLHELMRLVPDPVLEPATRSAGVRLPLGMRERRAVHREGFGCTVLPPGAPATARESIPTVPLPAPPAGLAARPWPEGDRLSDAPLPPEIDPPRLEAAIATAFDRARHVPSRTLGVVVVYRGRIVAERYAPGWGPYTTYRTWSTAKSLTAALVGIAVGQGRLALGAPPPIPEWSARDDPRRAITLRHLLHMSSGLASPGAWTPNA